MHYTYGTRGSDPPKQAFELVDLAALYDPGDWYVTAERFDSKDEALGDTTAWYLGGGYRIGAVTPYGFISRMKQTDLGTTGIAPVFDQKTVGVGLRWDFFRNLAAKVQYERVAVGSTLIPTSFVNTQPGFELGDRAHVFSATIDFVTLVDGSIHGKGQAADQSGRRHRSPQTGCDELSCHRLYRSQPGRRERQGSRHALR